MVKLFFWLIPDFYFSGQLIFFCAERDFALPPENIPRILFFGGSFFLLGTTLSS